MSSVLMKAVVELAAFLALSDDAEVDPDAAVKQLEDLAAILQSLDTEERVLLSKLLADCAQTEVCRPGQTERAAFFETFLERFGLI